ncbi:AraD Ribulose-5-phosphate 4-epimerase and related epimerases and aldolases [Candidatus Methylacidiphilaceae bacterium]
MKMTQRYKNLQREAYLANKKLHLTGLVKFSFGNVSVVDRSRQVMAIKPSGVAYTELKESDIVVVDFNGKVISGTLRPSSDTLTHLAILKSFLHANSVVHTHSPMATAFAQAGVALKCLGTTHADYFAGDVPVTRRLSDKEIKSSYERNTGQVILETFNSKDSKATPAVLVHSHGPFTWGADWGAAIENAEALEYCAHIALLALKINPKTLKISETLHNKHFSRKHGLHSYYGQILDRP